MKVRSSEFEFEFELEGESEDGDEMRDRSFGRGGIEG